MEGAVAKASFIDTVKTVLAGALGVRRRTDHESAKVKPLHLIVAALVFMLLFIFTLLGVVHVVLS